MASSASLSLTTCVRKKASAVGVTSPPTATPENPISADRMASATFMTKPAEPLAKRVTNSILRL